MPTWASTLAAIFLYSLSIEIQPPPVSTVFVRLGERNLWYFFQNCLFSSTFEFDLEFSGYESATAFCNCCVPFSFFLYIFRFAFYILSVKPDKCIYLYFFLSLTLVPSAFVFFHRPKADLKSFILRSHFLSAPSASRSAIHKCKFSDQPVVAFLSLWMKRRE
jgi:hypothetical protein